MRLHYNEEKWHCGYNGTPSILHHVQKDIPHYFRLVELRNK